MKKILVISWFYPPINSSEGLVTFKLLNNSKFQYDVFTQKNHESWSYGNNVEFKNSANIKSIYGNSNNIQEWIDEAVAYFETNHDKYDIVMTRAMPQESHVVGLRIKEKFPDVTWIASFGDPIKENPYHYISCSLYSINSLKNKINHNMSLRRKLSLKRNLYCLYWNLRHYKTIKFRRLLAKIQDDTMRNADYIILNNESQQKYMLKEKPYLMNKAILLHHSYEPAFYPKKKYKKHDKIRFVFIGHLDEIRTAHPLLEAIEKLNKEIEHMDQKAEFFFYGDLADSDKLFIMNHELLDIVQFKKPVSYLESLTVMQDADWLIHIDANIGKVVNENIFFAAKIADYFGSQSNVLAITMQSGDVVDILRKANALVLSYSSEEIKNYLFLILEQGYRKKIDLNYVKEFESAEVAKKFDSIIRKIRKVKE